jgi:preprotein translocase subunit YajC
MPPATQINPLLVNLPPLIIIFAIFYFMIIRPQKKQEKERLDMLNKLAKNDEVVTSGGIHGTIVNVKEKTVNMRIDENVKIEIEKSAIASLIKKSQ